jgi:hypothetical protein
VGVGCNCGFEEREMGFRKLCLMAGLGALATLLFAPNALAWTFSASASAACDRSAGEHVITWAIDNRTEPEALTIRESSRSSVPVGRTVAARSIGQFAERVVGSTTGTLVLTVKGNWPSDRTLRTRSAWVALADACLADVCPNLEGVQTQVPSGMAKDADGNCNSPPADLCPNVEGVQEQVPAGMVKDASGDCFAPPPPPDDVCPNLEGVQTALPEGFVEDEEGNCVPQPRVVTAVVETTIEKTVEKQVEVPGPERVVTISAAPSVVEKVIERVVRRVVIKRVKAVAKKKAKRAKRKARPRALPFTP